MDILITGAYGFIGYHLAVELHKQGHKIYIIDNFSKKQDTVKAEEMYDEFILMNDNVIEFNIDLTKLNKSNIILSEINFDIVFHLAAINGTKNFYNKPTKVIENNFLGTMNILKCVKCKKFVFTSSCEAYASTVNRGFCDVPTDENVLLSVNDVFNPRWSYGGTKILEELFVKNYCTENDIDFLILRYHNIYGIRDSVSHVIPALIKRVWYEIANQESGKIKIYGDCTRSFLYIDDCIKYTIKLAMEQKNNVFNVGMEEEVKISKVAELIMDEFDVKFNLDIEPEPNGSVKRRCPKMDKTINATGFKPKFDLKNGLHKMIKYYKKINCVV